MSGQLTKGIDFTGVCAVFLCHDGEGNVLMNLRSSQARDEHGTWDIGGGGLRFGEKIEDCLVREIREEYCTDVVSHDFLGYRDIHREHQGDATHWIALDFIVLVDRSQVSIGDPVKMEKIEWFSLSKMPPWEKRHSQAPVFWQQYEAQIAEITQAVPERA